MSDPKFLMVRFRAIGDCVMAAWAATAIRERYPEGYLTWAVEGTCAPVIDRHRLVSQRFELPRDKWKTARWSVDTWRQMVVKYTRLRPLRFDYGLDFQGHFKTSLLVYLAKPKRRIAADGTDPVSRVLVPVMPGRPEGLHTVEWNHRVLSSFGEFRLPERPILPVSAEGRDPRYVTISVGAGHPTKVYPLDRWVTIAETLRDRGFRVAFLGGPRDPSPEIEGVTSLVGKMRLKETINEVASSGLHLASDTGSGHIAAAVGTPVVSVFGPMPSALYRPYTRLGTVLERNGDPNQISVEEMLAAADHWLRIPA